MVTKLLYWREYKAREKNRKEKQSIRWKRKRNREERRRNYAFRKNAMPEYVECIQ